MGVGMNFNPFARKLIWSFVSSFLERFFVFLSASIVIMRTFLAFVLSVFFALISC